MEIILITISIIISSIFIYLILKEDYKKEKKDNIIKELKQSIINSDFENLGLQNKIKLKSREIKYLKEKINYLENGRT